MRQGLMTGIILVMLASSVYAAGEDTGIPAAEKSATNTSTTFAGMKFGIGLSLSYAGSQNRKRIENAEVVGGVVRVTEEATSVARVLLETHYLIKKEQTYGHGPFIAFQPGTNEIIQAIGAGYMVAFRDSPQSPTSWNFGIGLLVEPKIRTLGDGITANQPLPAGETQVRFKTTSRNSILLFSSYTF